jgi:hypothetical protein
VLGEGRFPAPLFATHGGKLGRDDRSALAALVQGSTPTGSPVVHRADPRHLHEVTNPTERSHDVELLVAMILAEFLEGNGNGGVGSPGSGAEDPEADRAGTLED